MEIAKEILKKHILSIVSGLVILLAVIALFYPIGGMYADTKATLEARKKDFNDLHTLISNKRNWPVTPDPDNPTQAALDLFPNDARIEKGNEIRKRVHEQAADMLNLTSKDNVHEQLLPNALPTPSEQRFKFQSDYLDMVQKQLPIDVGAVVPPTDAEIQTEATRLFNSEYSLKIVKVGDKAINQQQVVKDWQDACALLPQKMRLDRAGKAKVYMDPAALTVHKAMLNSPQGPKEDDIWYAQNSLWVQQDVLGAIKRINSSAKDVRESPIKQILKLEIPEDQTQYLTNPTITPAGRVSGGLYDIVQFNLTLYVDARQIPQIMTELQRGRLMTIDLFQVASINAQTLADDGYVFGPAPIVLLTIRGEDLYLRDWTTKLMPDPIKTKLGIATR